MLIVFIPKALMIMRAYPVRTVSDEIATVSGAAYAAGYDWSTVVSHAGFYGQGFYILFWWVFRLTDNPIKIQHTILYCCAALQSLTVPIVFRIARKHFHLKNRIAIFLLSVLAGYLTVNRILIMYNENFLNLYVWIVVLVLMEAVDAGKREFTRRKAGWSLLLCILLGWGIAIHLRMLVLVIAFLMAEAAWRLIDVASYLPVHRTDREAGKSAYEIGRRKILREQMSDFLYLLPLGAALLAGRAFMQYIQKAVWVPQAGQKIRNTSTAVKVNVDWKNLTYLKAISGVVFGQINTYQVFSCGLGLLAVLLLFVFLRQSKHTERANHASPRYIHRETASHLREDSQPEKPGKAEENAVVYKKVFLSGLMLLLAVLGTIGAQAINWGNGIYTKMAAGEIDGVYNYKGFTYIRYFGIYAGALTVLGLMCGFRMAEEAGVRQTAGAWQKAGGQVIPAEKGIKSIKRTGKAIASGEDKENKEYMGKKGNRAAGRSTAFRILLVDGVILAFLQVFWLAVPQKYLAFNWDAREAFITFAQWYRGKEFRVSPYLYGIAFLILFFALTAVLCHYGKYRIITAAAAVVLMAEYYFAGIYFDFADQSYQYNRINDSWQYLSRLAETGREETGGSGSGETAAADVEKAPAVYCCDLTGDRDHNSWYLLQFYLPRWKVVPVDADDVIFSGIVQANRPDYDPVGDLDIPWQRVVLDEEYNEYIYLVGEETIEQYGDGTNLP